MKCSVWEKGKGLWEKTLENDVFGNFKVIISALSYILFVVTTHGQ